MSAQRKSGERAAKERDDPSDVGVAGDVAEERSLRQAEQAAAVPYYCQIHGEPGSGMTGVVTVQAAPVG